MSAENLNLENQNDKLDEATELADELLEDVSGGGPGATKKLVCDTCGYSIAADVLGVKKMTTHCTSQHKNKAYHVE